MARRKSYHAGMKLPITGGCACGAIRYESSASPLFALNYHCRDCQRASGGGFSSVFIFPESAVTFSGVPRYHEVKSSQGTARRGFCADCGSPLFGHGSTGPGLVGIKPASLDDPSCFEPLIDIWTASAQPWTKMDPALPKFPGAPPHGQ